MAKILETQKPYSFTIRKEFKCPVFYGAGGYGNFWYGGLDFSSGIYQMRKCIEGNLSCRSDFYNYVITHTPGQQTNREKFLAAVAGWQGLTEEQKEVYNRKAVGKRLSGYNLFLREFLLS